MTGPRSEGVKVYVKAKDRQPLKLEPAAEQKKKQPASTSTQCPSRNSEPEKREKTFIDAVGEYQFKKVFQTEEPKKKDVIEWGSPGNPFLSKRKWRKKTDSNNLTQLLLSIGGAILVGTVMGFSVLNLFFSDDSTHSSSSIDDHLPDSNVTQVKKEHSSTGSGSSTAGTSVPLPALQVVMLQAGNYSEKAGAQKMVQNYRTQGLAAVMSQQAPYRIFLGVGMNRDDALKLSAIYQKQDVDVYLKEIKIQGHVQKEQSDKLSTIISTGHKLVQELGEASVRDIKSDSSQAPAFTFQPSMINQYQQFVTKSQTMEASLPEPAKESLAEMIRALDQAVQSGQEAQKNPSQALLWQIQEGLVRYVTAYEQLVQTSKP